MRHFIVTLHEEAGDRFTMVFECQADDFDHAEEQARNAYPAGEIINVMLDARPHRIERPEWSAPLFPATEG